MKKKVMKYSAGSKSSDMKKKQSGETKQDKPRTRRPAPVEMPVSNDPLIQALEEERRIQEANTVQGKKYGGKVKKMAGGGKCRGMGKASRGGNYSRNG